MEFVAIVERRSMHRYIHIPALDTGSALPDGDDPQAFATVLLAAALGVPATDLRVLLLRAALGETFVPTPPADVEILTEDGVWLAAVQVGWLRHWHGSWGPLVSYTAAGTSWTRALHGSRVRPAHPDTPAVPHQRRRTVPEPQPTP